MRWEFSQVHNILEVTRKSAKVNRIRQSIFGWSANHTVEHFRYHRLCLVPPHVPPTDPFAPWPGLWSSHKRRRIYLTTFLSVTAISWLKPLNKASPLSSLNPLNWSICINVARRRSILIRYAHGAVCQRTYEQGIIEDCNCTLHCF